MILCLVLYRHNLSQLIHPVKERCSIKDWKDVFAYLEISIDQPNSTKKYNRSKVRTILDDISEGYPSIKFYTFAIALTSILSIISSEFALRVSLSFNSHFTYLLFPLVQLVSSVPSIFAMQRFFGSFPTPPYKFHLKKNRTGSLLKYTPDLNRKDNNKFRS